MVKRQKWKRKEEQDLQSFVLRYGNEPDWEAIASNLTNMGYTKNAKQCHDRWMQRMSPDLDRSKWTSEDSQKLFELHSKFTNRWKLITEIFPGRTDNSVKNQFFSMIRKALRKACKIIGATSNTSAINRIKPKILASYLCLEYSIKFDDRPEDVVTISLRDFIIKFAFTPYRELLIDLKERDFEIIDKCVKYLYQLNEKYVQKKQLKACQKLAILQRHNSGYSGQLTQLSISQLRQPGVIRKRGRPSLQKTIQKKKADINFIENCRSEIQNSRYILDCIEKNKDSQHEIKNGLTLFYQKLTDFSNYAAEHLPDVIRSSTQINGIDQCKTKCTSKAEKYFNSRNSPLFSSNQSCSIPRLNDFYRNSEFTSPRFLGRTQSFALDPNVISKLIPNTAANDQRQSCNQVSLQNVDLSHMEQKINKNSSYLTGIFNAPDYHQARQIELSDKNKIESKCKKLQIFDNGILLQMFDGINTQTSFKNVISCLPFKYETTSRTIFVNKKENELPIESSY